MTTECTPYMVNDSEERLTPCKCPICGGFLKWPDVDEEPICNKCGAELIAYPDIDEETKETLECGKICVIGKPKPKIVRIEDLRVKRKCKVEAKKWKGWL